MEEIKMERQYNHLYKKLYSIGAALGCLLLLLLVLRFLPADALSQPAIDINREQELDTRIRTFFGALSRENSSSAFEELLRGSPLGSSNANLQTTDLRNKVDELGQQFGGIIDWEEYEIKRMGKDVIVMRYILKYDQYPIIWTFAFYRKPTSTSSLTTSNSWVLIELRYDTNIL
jgi:hypothetical protein